ncbi:MAG TPA: hypothetical protein VJ810_09400 [Blastocatellia bacterium]|nr:hypothetical protein [Blastocatellia bacterium]
MKINHEEMKETKEDQKTDVSPFLSWLIVGGVVHVASGALKQ